MRTLLFSMLLLAYCVGYFSKVNLRRNYLLKVPCRIACQIKLCDLESPFGYRGNCLLCLGIHLESIKSYDVMPSDPPIQTIVGIVTQRKEIYNVQVSDSK